MINPVFLSDIHFGHPRLDPCKLYEKLKLYVYPEIVKSQVVFFLGDLFHFMLTLSHPASYYAILFLNDLILMSKQYGFKIRFIRGTFSHDRDQQVIIKVLNHQKIDCKVINDIEVETLRDWNNGSDEELKVVYLPDSLPYKNSDQIVKRVKELYGLVGWDTAELLIGHGTFSHTLPENITLPPCTFNIDQFKDIINGYIVMGHIHTPSRRENVIYVGSFERMAHGEEERKGFLICSKDHEHWKFKFIENKHAVKFFTLVPKGDTHDEIIKSFMDQLEQKFIVKEGNVRVIHSNPEIKSILNRICSTKYPNIRFSSKNDNTQRSELKLEDVQVESFESEVLDLDNLCTLITNSLQNDTVFGKFNYSREDIYGAIKKLGVQ